MDEIRRWFQRYLSDPQVVFLTLSLVGLFLLIGLFGDILMPLLASVVIAYLLEGVVQAMERWGLPRLTAVLLVFGIFLLVLLFVVIALVPLLVHQLTQLFQQIPGMIDEGRRLLMTLPERYPLLFSQSQIEQALGNLGEDLNLFRQQVLSRTLSVGIGVLTFMVYLILMPILVFFLLKDKNKILDWFRGYLPTNHSLALEVWREVDLQVANYVRGKFWEIIIVWLITFVTLALLGLDYAALLGAVVGFSVLIPYVGAAVATVPVAAVAWFQFGWGPDLLYVLIAYAVIQFFDGNILVPLMFSEVVNLHPVAIIAAILFFGGIWGFWGIFFAIPLATVVQAVLRAWPRHAAHRLAPSGDGG